MVRNLACALAWALALPVTASALHAKGADTSMRLHELTAARDWRGGTAACRYLPQDEARRPDAQRLPPSHYADVAAHCAALASGAGEPEAASWWWFTAVAMDSERALELLPAFRDAGLLTDLPPPRQAAHPAREKLEKDQVRLPDGRLVDGEPAVVSVRPKTPSYVSRAARGVRHSEVTAEVLIDEEGRPQQPVFVAAKALPLQTFLMLLHIRDWRFTPARVDGQPVTSTYQLTVSTTTMPAGR